MTSKTSFMKYFLIAFTLMFISSGLNAGTFGSDGKKKDKEKKEELTDEEKEKFNGSCDILREGYEGIL